MPNSDDYRLAAVQLNRVADDVRTINGPLEAASGPEVLSGGNLGASLEAYIADATAEAVVAAAELEDLAAVAKQRAAEAEREESELAAASFGAAAG